MINFNESRKEPLVIAHRGASTVAPENTLDAFNAAIEIGAHAVEFDVRRTRDGQLVIIHDDALDNGTLVAHSTYDELRVYGLAKGFVVPTLEEAVQCCANRISLDVELKDEGIEAETVQIVLSRYQPENVLFKSFNDTSVAALKKSAPDCEVGLLLGVPPPTTLSRRISELFPGRRLRSTQADFVCPHWRLVRFMFLSRMKLSGWPVLVWTVDDAALARDLVISGARGVITNVPQIVLEAFAAETRAQEGLD